MFIFSVKRVNFHVKTSYGKSPLLIFRPFKTSRSSGKGGQNVNKTETKVSLWFDVAASTLFDDENNRIRKRLATYITDDGSLPLRCDEHRSQQQNKQSVIERAGAMLEKALVRAKPRKPSKPSKSSVEKRLETKRRNALKKMDRGKFPEFY